LKKLIGILFFDFHCKVYPGSMCKATISDSNLTLFPRVFDVLSGKAMNGIWAVSIPSFNADSPANKNNVAKDPGHLRKPV
jgi:hypothetical protein